MMSLLNAIPSQSLRVALLVLVVGVGTAGCDHVTDPDGPNLVDRFGSFNFVEPVAASQPTVDFAAGEDIVFSATFNKQADWVLEITGRESGAVKRIEGFSNVLDATNATWNGGTTELPFFNEETVDVALFVPSEETDTLRTTVEVLSPRTYPGNVVAAFDGGDNITLGNFEFEFQGTGLSTNPAVMTDIPPAQGNAFWLFRGTDSNLTNFFVGLIDIRPTGGLSFFATPTSVPEDLYFNMFLYGPGVDYTIAVVQVIVDGNGSGAFEDGQDTVFPFGDVPVDFTGWQAFSKPVSELGLTQAQAQQIVAVRALLISDENAQPNPPQQVAYGIDYITFTAGGPLEL